MNDDLTITLDDVIAELDPLGAALFDAASCRAVSKKQAAVIVALQAQVAELKRPREDEKRPTDN